MRCLLVEDEFTSRKILQKILMEFGECDVAVDGREASEAFSRALEDGAAYDVVFLDIMLPHMEGQEVLRSLRDIERRRGVEIGSGAHVIMTTALNDASNVLQAFRTGCESYLVKPIDRDKVTAELRKLGLLSKGQEASA